MSNTINNDAREFGLHVKQGGWRLGLLVARSVEPGAGQSERGSRLRNHDDEKISAAAFAKQAGTSADRVLRHLGAWEKAAEAGYVPAAGVLSPGQDVDLDADNLPDWSEFYTAKNAGYVAKATKKAAEEAAAKAKAEAEAKAARDLAAALDRQKKEYERQQREALLKQKNEQDKAIKAEADRIRKEEQAKAIEATRKQRAKDKAEYEAKVAEITAKYSGQGLDTLTSAQKAALISEMLNSTDPEVKDQMFTEYMEALARKNKDDRRKAEEAAEDNEAERARKAAERRAEEIRVRRSKEYEDSSLYKIIEELMPIAQEARNLLSSKPFTHDNLLTAGFQSFDPIYNMAYSLETLAVNLREHLDLLNAEVEMSGVRETE